MKVRFVSSIKQFTGCDEAEVEGCAAVDELLHKLSIIYGENFRNAIYRDEQQDTGVIITVNGRHIARSGGVKTVLHDKDEVSIFPVIIGG